MDVHERKVEVGRVKESCRGERRKVVVGVETESHGVVERRKLCVKYRSKVAEVATSVNTWKVLMVKEAAVPSQVSEGSVKAGQWPVPRMLHLVGTGLRLRRM